MNRNEDPAETIQRELLEETGLQVIPDRPLLIYRTSELRNHLDVAFLCHALPGPITLSAELLDYRWVDPTDPPPLLAFHRQVVAAAILARKQMAAVAESMPTIAAPGTASILTNNQELLNATLQEDQ